MWALSHSLFSDVNQRVSSKRGVLQVLAHDVSLRLPGLGCGSFHDAV